MRYLIICAGSHGDILPFIKVGVELKQRGNEVKFFTNPFFEPFVHKAGLDFQPVSTKQAYYELFCDERNKNPFTAFQKVSDHFFDIAREVYPLLVDELQQGANVATIGHPLAFAPRILAEIHGTSHITVHLAPVIFRSIQKPARVLPIWADEGWPKFFRKLSWSLLDRFYCDPIFTKPMNRWRKELGLLPISKMIRHWATSAEHNVGLFPESFAMPQSDWNTNVYCAGFPLDVEADLSENTLSDEIESFLQRDNRPIIAFTPGTASGVGQEFFKTSIQACQDAGYRGILLSHFDQVPKKLPDDIVHFDYVPFSALLPRLNALVHHGGIGSSSMALAAGVPQLIRPVAYDQFDNAQRIVDMGVAKQLYPLRYTAKNVAKRLQYLAENAALSQRCKAIAKTIQVQNGVKNASDYIERLFAIQ